MRARLISLMLAACVCLSLAGCGGLAGAMGGILIEPAGHEDGASHLLGLKYAGAGGSDMIFEVFALRGGTWTGPQPSITIPDVAGEGSLDVIFEYMPERISARVTGGDTEAQSAAADMGDLPEPDAAMQGVVYITGRLNPAPGERVPVAMQYYGGDEAPSLGAYDEPAGLAGYDAVYVLTVKFE